jgi:hypothetical protein
MFAPTMLTTCSINTSLKQFRVLLTYSTISSRVRRFISFSRRNVSVEKSNTTEQTSIFFWKSSHRSVGGASRSLGRAAKRATKSSALGPLEAFPSPSAPVDVEASLLLDLSPEVLLLPSSVPAVRLFTV